MTERFTLAPLGPAHDRAAFTWGVAALDRYLRELATQDIRRRGSNCFVAVDATGKVAGYYTLAATSLPLPELAPEHARRLLRYGVMPAALIGRLAVDQASHGRGLGSALLVDAVARTLRADPAIFALLADAKDEDEQRFYLHHGFRSYASRPMTLYLPLAEAARRLGAAPC